MTIQDFLIDFSDWAPLINSGNYGTKTAYQTDVQWKWVQDSQPLQGPDNDPTSGIGNSYLVIGNYSGLQYKTNSYTFICCVKWASSPSSSNTSMLTWEFLDDQGNTMYFDIRIAASNQQRARVRTAGGSTNWLGNTGNADWTWYKFDVVVNGNDRDIFVRWNRIQDSETEPASITEKLIDIDGGGGAEFDKITYSNSKNLYHTQLRINGTWSGTVDSNDAYVSSFKITSDDEPYVDNPLADLSGKGPLLVGWSMGLGAIGSAGVRANDTGIADSSVGTGLRKYIKKLLTITDQFYGKVWFTGEIITLEMANNSFTYIAEAITKKMLKIETGYQNTVKRFALLFGESTLIRDFRGPFATGGEWDGKFIAFEKKVPRRIIAHPTALVPYDVSSYSTSGLTLGSTYTPHYENLSSNRHAELYYKKYPAPLYSQDYYTHGDHSDEAGKFRGHRIDVDFWAVTGTVLTDLILEMEFEPYILGGINAKPTLYSYDYTDAQYRHIQTFGQAAGYKRANVGTFSSPGSGNKRNKKISFVVALDDISASVELDFVSDLATASGNFSKFRIRLFMVQGDTKEIGVRPADLMEYFVSLSMNTSIEQSPEESAGTISATTATTITLNGSGANSWQSKELPQEDGFTDGDEFIVCDDMYAVLVAAWAAHDIANFIGLDIETNFGEDIPITRDIQYENFYNLFQELSKKKNGLWYYKHEPESTPQHRIKLIAAANIVPTGVTFRRVDFVDYGKESFTLRIDTSRQRDFVRVVGDSGIVYTSGDLSGEFEPALGPETRTIFDKDVKYTKQAIEIVTTESATRDSADIFIQGKIDLGDGSNAYGQLNQGESVKVELQDVTDFGSEPPTYSLVDDTLIIMQIQGKRAVTGGWQDELTVILQKRLT